MFYNVVSVDAYRARIRSEVCMQDERKEFTLKQMGEVLKTGWLTILIFVLVAAIVFGSVAAIVKTVATKSEYRAKIGFANTVETDNLTSLTSSENISKSLRDLGMKEEEIPGYVDAIRASISITPIVYSNQTDSETQFVPSSYQVTMEEIEGLTEAKSTQILNQIVTNFVASYNQLNMSASVDTENEQAFADYTSSDYVEIAYEVSTKIKVMKKTAQSIASRSATFVSSSTNMTFSDFISMLDSVESQIESFDGYITLKGITKDTTGLSASEYITMRVNIAESEQIKYQEIETKWKEVVDQVTANGSYSGTIDGQTIVINGMSQHEYEFIMRYIEEAVKYAAEASAEYNEWQNKQAIFDAATEFKNASAEDKAAMLADADKKVALLVSSTVQMIEIYNDMVGDYNESGISSASSASLITPAYVTSTSPISNTMMLLIIALAVVLAALIGFVRARNRYLLTLDAQPAAAESGAKIE